MSVPSSYIPGVESSGSVLAITASQFVEDFVDLSRGVTDVDFVGELTNRVHEGLARWIEARVLGSGVESTEATPQK